jgi:quinol monooxygenase YgiN
MGGAGDAAGASPLPGGRWTMDACARSVTIMAQPDRIDDGIALNSELVPMMTRIDGCLGLSMLVERSTGRCISTSSWDSKEAMHASNEQLRPVRQRLLEALGGDSLEVAEWEVAIFHRDHESPAGACARVTWSRPPAGRLDAALEAFRANVLPQLEQQRGFCSQSMLVDRENGVLCGTTCFDSMAALEATREFSAERRAEMAERTGMEFIDVIECELAVHHLRVPELV